METFLVVPRHIIYLKGITLKFIEIYSIIFGEWSKNYALTLERLLYLFDRKEDKLIVREAIDFFEKSGELKKVLVHENFLLAPPHYHSEK